MDAKNKSNIKLLSIVASVMLLIIVVGASFAYFGTYKEDIDKYKINITIDQFAKATFVTKDANLNLSVSKKDMVAYEAGTKAAENSANLNVVLTSGNPNVKVTCTYDIYYEYDTNSSIYGVSPTPVTDSSLKELTLKAVGSTGTNNYADEKNFNYDTSWTQNPYKRLIVKGASITDATKNGTTDTWNFNMAFYNLDADQNKLAGKTFAGTFYVDKDSIQCDYEENKSLYNEIEKRYNKDKTYLGLYDGEGADTYANPVYYYKGNVQNNNVLFGGFCWKIVRTTETGGVKIVYNGKQKDVYESYEEFNSNEYTIVSNDATYPYTFDSTNEIWKSNILDDSGNGTEYIIELSPTQDGEYLFNINMHNESADDSVELYLNDNYIGYGENCGVGCFAIDDTDSINLSLSTSDVIEIIYYKHSTTTDNSDYVDFSLQKGVGNSSKSCNNTGGYSQIGESKFNEKHNSPAYVGYMYNKDKVYTYSIKSMSSQSNIVFGNSFTYSNGTYTLTSTKTVTTWSSGYNTINNNHYTCMTTGTTCSSIYYVYYTSSSYAYYITLANGKSVDDVLIEMLYADDVNKNDSTIKTYIDNWYESKIKGKYEDKLEDTVFCNNRGILNLNGWNPNGGSTTNELQFKNYGTSNQSLVCANETDRFSHSNAKAYLKYPIGLLSVQELNLAGYGSSHYFNNKQYVWLASPGYFNNVYAVVWGVNSDGSISDNLAFSGGVRPSVSIKPGTSYSSGDGSYTSPFVIE